MNEKYCGNCKHFKNEDIEGWGWCSFNKTKTHCAQSWDCHNNTFNGWTKITQDNKHLLTKEMINKVVLGWFNHKGEWRIAGLSECTIEAVEMMASRNTFYYFVLPELKIE